MADKVRVTVKEKILIHLFGFSKFKDEFEVPQKVTQDGMAKVIGVRRSHIASALKDLRISEFIEEKKTRIEGNERRKNAYFLTPQGETEALRIKESVLEKEVQIKAEDGSLKEVKISEIGEHLDKKLSLIEILSCISHDGIYEEKVEEIKEPDRSVLCPFCAHTNFNFELKKVQLNENESSILVACMFCGNEFLTSEKMTIQEDGAQTYTPIPFPVEQPKIPSLPTGNPFLVSLGLFFMMGSFILALLVGLSTIPNEFCLLAPLGFILSLIVLYIGLKDVRHLEAISRRLLIITGTIFVTFVATFVALILGAEFELEQAGTMAIVIFPAFGLFAFGKPLSSNLRSELSLSLGVFLVLFGVFLSVLSDIFQWSMWYSPFWVIAGAVMVFASYEIHRLDLLLMIRAVCVGGGAFSAIFCIVILNSWYSDFGIFKIVSILLWLLYSILLVALRFVSVSTFKEILSALKTSLLTGLGLLFILVGIFLVLNSRFMEAGVELFIGVPIMWYGLSDARRLAYPKLGIIVYVLAAEVFSVLSFILT
jgi:DNA-directed RNA polymerase subunit M/transcription elongation factor TFIIS